jgi:predicted transcriptional regulator of viral defense system
MKFREFENQMKRLPAFNLNDVRKLDPGFHRQQLSYWLAKDLIKSLAGGYYILANQTVDEQYIFTLANTIYQPSYISLESALAYYGVIPESVLGVTSVSSRKTIRYQSAWGEFKYRSVKPVYMFGYLVVEAEQKRKYTIARLEKAVLDYLYLNPGTHSVADFEGLRWNRTPLQQLGDNPLFSKYLSIFDSEALENRAGRLWEYIHA